MLALLIVVPLMTSAARRNSAGFFHLADRQMGDWSTHNTPQRPLPRPAHHELNFPVADFHPPVRGPITNSRQDPVLDGDGSSVFPDGYIPGAIKMTDFSAAHSPVEPPSVDTNKNE